MTCATGRSTRRIRDVAKEFEWVIGDEEGPATDEPIASDVTDLLALEAAGRWACIGVWWRPLCAAAAVTLGQPLRMQPARLSMRCRVCRQ